MRYDWFEQLRKERGGAVGGVNETNVSQFLKAGFVGAAAGSNLVPRKSTDGNLELIRQKARLYVQAMEREA